MTTTTALAELDAPEDLKEHVSACVEWSQLNSIACPDDFTATGEHLKEIKKALKAADDFFDPVIKSAYETHKLLVGRKKTLTAPLEQSEKIDKQKMLGYQQEEQRKAEAERRRLQAIADESARREKEKIESQAARQRAIEAEQRAKAEAARLAEEKARREAEAASAAKRKRLLEEAEAARKEAEAADRKAAAAQAKQDVQEEKAAAVVAPVIAVASAAPKAAGISTRRQWKAEIVDLPAFLAYCCENKRFDLLLPNDAVLQALAKGLKSAAEIPGVRFEETSSIAARS